MKEFFTSGRYDEGFQALVKATSGTRFESDVVLLQGNYANVTRNERLGMLSFSEAQIQRARILSGVFDIISDLDKQSPKPASATQQPTTTMQKTNVLVEFDDLYRDGINRDLKGSLFVEEKLRQYVQKLANIFNMPQQFGALLNPLNQSDYTFGSEAEKRNVIKGVLETLVSKHDGWRSRLESKVVSENLETTFQETIANFLKNPTTKNWKTCFAAVNDRLANQALYGPKVESAWRFWADQFNGLDEYDLGFEMAVGTQMHTDFLVWLRNNLNIKDFNY